MGIWSLLKVCLPRIGGYTFLSMNMSLTQLQREQNSLSNDIRICIYDGLPASYGQRKSRLMVETAEKLVFYTGKLVKLQMKLEF